ncbi:MAG: NADH-quinone oxidoreductase subunit I [Acidobacteria bacterium]|nr:NADH-quinone oxidoreductase subunit I [Acidobacteriota bacterium]
MDDHVAAVDCQHPGDSISDIIGVEPWRSRKSKEIWDSGRRPNLPEIAKGLRLTARHFFRNLFIHMAHSFGWAQHLRAGETYQYPEERRPLSPRLRTLHRLTRRQDGSPRCVACMMCETVCPAHCIYIVGGEHPNPQIEKYPIRFDIDLGVCVFCGYCVEACPEDAIRMDTGILEFSSYSREGLILDAKQLLSHSPVPK